MTGAVAVRDRPPPDSRARYELSQRVVQRATRPGPRRRSRPASPAKSDTAGRHRHAAAPGWWNGDRSRPASAVDRLAARTGQVDQLRDRARTPAWPARLSGPPESRRSRRDAATPAGSCPARRQPLRRAVNDLTALLAATRRVAAQGRQRLAGTIPDGATRRVSLHDGDARPIAKGRLGKSVEFGYKAQVLDNDDGVVLDHTVDRGNPPDARQLAPAVERVITRTGRRPRTVTADRRYGEASVDDALHALGVRKVVIPRKGKPGKLRQTTEHRRAFRRTIKWRTGCEGRISSLKRGYGWDRTRLDGTDGARIWTGQAVLATTWSRSGRWPADRRRAEDQRDESQGARLCPSPTTNYFRGTSLGTASI